MLNQSEAWKVVKTKRCRTPRFFHYVVERIYVMSRPELTFFCAEVDDHSTATTVDKARAGGVISIRGTTVKTLQLERFDTDHIMNTSASSLGYYELRYN